MRRKNRWQNVNTKIYHSYTDLNIIPMPGFVVISFPHGDLHVLNTNSLYFVYFGWATVVLHSLPSWWSLHPEQWSTNPKTSQPWRWRQIDQDRISQLEKGMSRQKLLRLCKSRQTCLALHERDKNSDCSNNYFGVMFELRWNWLSPTRHKEDHCRVTNSHEDSATPTPCYIIFSCEPAANQR